MAIQVLLILFVLNYCQRNQTSEITTMAAIKSPSAGVTSIIIQV